jgi:hypothetical protein
VLLLGVTVVVTLVLVAAPQDANMTHTMASFVILRVVRFGTQLSGLSHLEAHRLCP